MFANSHSGNFSTSNFVIGNANTNVYNYSHGYSIKQPDPTATENAALKLQEPKLWSSDDPWSNSETMPQDKGRPLDRVYERVRKYDKDMCEGARDEIEHLLIFAGLFSATVTAFLVDSYKWLGRDNPEVSVRLLAQISLQLGAIATNGTAMPPAITVEELAIPDSRSVRINVFWFTSLVMCLSTVMFGILCLQWLREYTRDISISREGTLTIHQMRYEGLLKWKVPTIVSWLPVILQISVLLFFAGVLDLLWSVHNVVAAVITAFMGLVAVAILFTTFAPVVQAIANFPHFVRGKYNPQAYLTPCPYRSPLSWLAMRFVMVLDPVLFKQWDFLSSWCDFDTFSHEESMQPGDGRKTYNAKGLVQAFIWVMVKLSAELDQDTARDIYYSLHDTADMPTTCAILSGWAELTGEAHTLKTTLERLGSSDSGMGQVRYNLLMERFLRKSSPVRENRKTLLELQVRSLNTLGDKEMPVDMAVAGEIFSDVARNCYYYLLENKEACILKSDGLLFQSLVVLMNFYNRLYAHRETFVDDYLGLVMDAVIQHTEVDDGNKFFCSQVLDRFKQLFEGARLRIGNDVLVPKSPKSPDVVACSALQSRLDLRKVRIWEHKTRHMAGSHVSLVESITEFRERYGRGS